MTAFPRMLRLTLGLTLLSVGPALQSKSQAANAEALPNLDPVLVKRIGRLVADHVVPGLVIAVIQEGRSAILPFGRIAPGRPEAPDAHTVFELGSLTKTFTGLLLAEAVRRGEVGLDQPVEAALKGWKLPALGNRSITFLDLATQSSGLPRLPANLLPKDPQNPYQDYTVQELRAFLSGYQLPRAPGERYEYSNLGFGLLGQALGARAGKPFADLVAARIAGPLGLKDTTLAPAPFAKARLAPGHDAAGRPVPGWDMDTLAGAGALRGSAADLALYLRAHMRPSGPLKEALLEATKPRRDTGTPGMAIGLAWNRQAVQGREVVWHNGMTGGYASFAGFTADGKRGVVVLTNGAHDVTDLGMEALVGRKEAASAQAEVRLDAGSLQACVGRYRLAPGMELDVSLGAEGLEVQATGQGRFPVFPSAKDEFFYKVVEASLSFHRDGKGRVDGVVLHQGGHDSPAPRVEGEPGPKPAPPVEVPVDPTKLVHFPGTYVLAPGFLLVITLEGGKLHAQATGQPRFPLFASGPDAFFLKVVDARITFERDAEGKVRGLVLHQNGMHIPGPRQ